MNKSEKLNTYKSFHDDDNLNEHFILSFFLENWLNAKENCSKIKC